MSALLAAVRFLTVVKTPGGDVSPGRAAVFFPLVGALLGLAGAGVFLIAGRVVPVSMAALLTVAFWVAITGVLHEDGLADVADAVRAGRSRERMLAILKDSRVGTFGAIALVLSVAARWQSLEALATARWVEAIVASQTVPRAGMVAMAWLARPASSGLGSGLGAALAASLGSGGALVAIAQGVAAALWCGWRPAVVIVLGSAVILRLLLLWFYRRLGGVNGDCLGFAEQVLEVYVLVLFTCVRCAW